MIQSYDPCASLHRRRHNYSQSSFPLLYLLTLFQHLLPLTHKTSENEVKFPSTPRPYFNERFKSTFTCFQVYQNGKSEPNRSSVIMQNITHHSAVLSSGYNVYIEVSATYTKRLHYKVYDINSPIHTIFHS